MIKIIKLTALLLLAALSSVYGQEGWFVITTRGDRLAWVEADELSPSGDLIKIKKGNRYGLMDQNGNIVLKAKYEAIKGYSNGLAAVRHKGNYGFVSEKGYMVIDAIYDDATGFTEDGVAAVQKLGRWGFIDRYGKLFIDYIYAEASPFKGGYSVVRKRFDKTVGMINKDNKFVIRSDTYMNLAFPQEGMVAARIRGTGKWGFVDTRGTTIVSHKYKTAYSYSEGLAFVAEEYKFGAIDKTGNMVIDATYSDVKREGFNSGLAAVRSGGKWGFINKSGEVVIPFEYDDCSSFSQGSAAVLQDGYWGYIDTNGEMMIPFEFELATGFFRVKDQLVAIAKESPIPPPMDDIDDEESLIEDEEAMVVDEVIEEEEEEEMLLDEGEEEGEMVEETYEDEEEMYEEEPEEIKEDGELQVTKPGKDKTKGKGKGKGKKPKPSTKPQNDTTVEIDENAPAGIRFIEQMHGVEQAISDSRMAYNASLMYLNAGHADIDAFEQNARVARSKMNTALLKIRKATQQMNKAKTTSASMDCASANQLFREANSDLLDASELLETSSDLLNDTVSKSGLKAYSKSIEKVTDRLHDVEHNLRQATKALANCN